MVIAGEVWVNPRGRAYRVLRLEEGGERAVVVDVGTGKKDTAAVALMSEANGWRKRDYA